MMLAILIAVPLLTGALCLGVRTRAWAQSITCAGLLANCMVLALVGAEILRSQSDTLWLMEWSVPWIPSWSVYLHLGIDSFAYWLIVLTHVLALLGVYISYPAHRVSSYFACLNWSIFGVIGLFLSADAFLFFIFWELALLPIYWILLVDGANLELRQTLRFIVLTQISGLLLLVGIIGLAMLTANKTGTFTFDYALLSQNALAPGKQVWLLPLFLVAFLIKLPTVPFHGWMPSLFSRGPSSVILVAILVKTSVFGLVRFSWPVFPAASAAFAVPVLFIGVVTLLYGAVIAFAETDPKRIVAYGTLSHAGLLVMGIFCQQDQASFAGVMLLLVSSSLSTAAMLIMFERRRAINLSGVSGLWHSHPKFSVALLVMVLASMGFPVFGNFVGEWMILWSVFTDNISFAILASVGIVLSAAYGLRMFQRLCLSGAPNNHALTDLKLVEIGMLGAITLLIIGLGVMPAQWLKTVKAPVSNIEIAEVTSP